jgi:hypothetical protein
MKNGLTLLSFASLLLLGSLASAQQASMPADPGSALAAIFSTPASQGCAETKLPSNEPAPIEAAFLCNGACSDPVCLGKARGTVCKIQGGQTYRCQPALYVCAANDCQCWTGPLP